MISVIVCASREVTNGLTQTLVGVCIQSLDQALLRSPYQLRLHGQLNDAIALIVSAALPKMLVLAVKLT